MLKIFAGLYKGRKLKSVKHPDVRPTTAKVKLSFFDVMQDDIRETIFLDGFGGVGNIGIEALSRGAEYVVFIEHLPEVVKALQHNLDKIGIPADNYPGGICNLKEGIQILQHHGGCQGLTNNPPDS